MNAPQTGYNSQLPLMVQGLRFTGTHGRIIHDIDLELIHPGVTVIMGPNGAGKSVLLRLLHGLLKPEAGTIQWGGRCNGGDVREAQAMIFQRPILLRRSVQANLQFVLRQRKLSHSAMDCEPLLARVALAGKANMAARRLSGGEQQRLALARALAIKPQVLLMDEPAASLDPSSTKTIEEVVREQTHRGTKVILVTHDVGQAHRIADEVVFLHHGRVLEHTPASDFFNQPQSTEAAQYLAGEIII